MTYRLNFYETMYGYISFESEAEFEEAKKLLDEGYPVDEVGGHLKTTGGERDITEG